MDNTVCQLSTEKQFGIVVHHVHVMCEVALQRKSAQSVAPNIYWETPLNHNSYTPLPVKSHRICINLTEN